jgi:hypothetical protein
MLPILLALAVVIIIGLSWYAFTLTKRVKLQEQKTQDAVNEEQKKFKEKQAYIVESLRVISMNVVNEGLNLSEATIRCKVLLDGLLLQPEQRVQYGVLDDVYEQIKAFDTHQTRKSLSREQRKEQDTKREKIENENSEQLMQCFKSLQTFQLPVSS